jgi:hypothetical protein
MSQPVSSNGVGVQGWKQLLSMKESILGQYDVARSRAAYHEVQVFHGRIAEAAVREWLTEFLPQRYGVTPGYIVSQGLPETVPLRHFDIIIYDKLESPVICIDSNPDSSARGTSRIILAEHVRAVIEVKSSFEPSTVADAMAHLQNLRPLLADIDAPSGRYKRYLPPNFSTGLVFMELRRQHEFSVTALDNIVRWPLPRGYFEALILRGDGLPIESTGTIQLVGGDIPQVSTVGRDKGSLLAESSLSNSIEIDSHRHAAARLTWGRSQFSLFAFDLLAMVNGTYQPDTMSSLHGTSDYSLVNREAD